METKSAKGIYMTEVLVNPDKLEKAWNIWCKSVNNDGNYKTVYYRSGNSLIELCDIDNFNIIETVMGFRKEVEDAITPLLVSDFRRQYFTHIEDVIKAKKSLPSTKYLQLRYIEVPRQRYDEYISWRQKTIFASVKRRNEIEEFRAYHTLFSTQPGVMFFSGFSCEEEKYNNGFKSDEYQQIIKNAGTRYIAGGIEGLYTKIYTN